MQRISVTIQDYHKLELAEIFERTRGLENLRFQLGTFAGTANLTLIGVAFSFQKLGLLIIAIGLPVMNLIYDLQLRHILATLYGRGMVLEAMYTSDIKNALLHIYPPARPNSRFASIGGFWMPIVSIIVELIIIIRLWLLGWQLF